MRLTIIQDEIIWTDKQANFKKTEKYLKELSGKTDLVVLPEMFSTGFCIDRTDLAEDMNGETVSLLKKWVIEYDLAITGSFIVKENTHVYNRAFFIFPNGKIETADKRHLFSMGNEHKLFTAGNKRLLVNYKGFNICVLVCYDLRFPVWARNTNNKYDLLIYVANWPIPRITVWNALLPARAIENLSYVCGVNIIGTGSNNLNYNGNSKVIDFKGKEILSTTPNNKHIDTIELSLEELKKFREGFPVWKDADEFTIKI